MHLKLNAMPENGPYDTNRYIRTQSRPYDKLDRLGKLQNPCHNSWYDAKYYRL